MMFEGYSEYYPSNRSIKDSVHILNAMTVVDKQTIDGPKMIFGRELSQSIQFAHVADWANQLANYGIEFKPRTTIKAQALADFLAEMTGSMEEIPLEKAWKLYVDGSSTRFSSGAGLLIVSPDGARLKHSVRFSFSATNNEAEYEALLLGLGICLASGAKKVVAHMDSQMIAQQVKGEYEAKDDSMKMYLATIKQRSNFIRGPPSHT